MSRPRPSARLTTVLLVIVFGGVLPLASAGCLSASEPGTTVQRQRMKVTEIPAGEYDDLSAWETPSENIGPETDFVFEREIPGETSSTVVYWRGAPAADAQYMLNGKRATVAEFEDAMGKMPPYRVRVIVKQAGTLATIDAAVMDVPEP
jgi:hypothetical protein